MSGDPLVDVAAVAQWGRASGVEALMSARWGWPAAEVLHFAGLCLLAGTVLMLDLRLLGVARAVSVRSLHRTVPVGMGGFVLSAATGLLFVLTTPDQYLHNPAFLIKMALLLLAGLNLLGFYALAAPALRRAGDHAPAPLRARVFAAVSLACWLGVMACGRVITAYRPPAWYWCPWC